MFKILLKQDEARRQEQEYREEQEEQENREQRRTLGRASRALERISRRWGEPAAQAGLADELEPERTHWEPNALEQALQQQEQERLLQGPRDNISGLHILDGDVQHGDDDLLQLHQVVTIVHDASDPAGAAAAAALSSSGAGTADAPSSGSPHAYYATGPDANSGGGALLPPSSLGAPSDDVPGGEGGGGGGAGGKWDRRANSGRPKAVSKKALQHTWLRIDTLGRTSLVTTDKHRLALKLGVQPRDLRMLDAAMASVSPQTILDRERAIVVNLGPVKCIITLEYVLVVNPGDEAAKPLIQTLTDKLSNPMHVGKVISYPGLSALSGVRSRLQPPSTLGAPGGGGGGGGSSSGLTSASGSHTAGQQAIGLSFELKVLEICLDITVGAMDTEARELKDVIEPTLDDLTRRVRQQELELLRKCKNRLTRLVKRVETIKEVLEKFLQDDEDMHRLNLTAQEMIMARQATMHLDEPQGGSGGPTPRSGALGRHSRRLGRRASLASSGSSSSSSSSSGSSHSMDLEEEAQVAEVEMLLEAYQMHLDHLYNKLQSLEQFVEDGEDLVNVSLDEHRNRIIAVDVVITGFATAMGLGTAISGLFGVNIPFHDLIPNTYENFQMIAIFGAVIGPLLVMGSFVGWAVYTRAVTFG